MQRRFRLIAVLCLLLPLSLIAGCVTPLPPSAEEIAAKRFETVPGKAVVYLFRDIVNYGVVPAPVALDGIQVGSSFGGTFFRFVLEPGRHRIEGMYVDNGAIEITVAANQLYFLQQTVQVTRNVSLSSSTFNVADATTGRSRVVQYQLTGF